MWSSGTRMTPPEERAYRNALTAALHRGFGVLRDEGTSLDAVQAAVEVLEDSPSFNAGRGSVFTSDGTHELEASIMNGHTLEAGAVTGVKRIKNPVALARLIMERSPHVMLAGEGAEAFAAAHGMPLVPEAYFYTQSAGTASSGRNRRRKCPPRTAMEPLERWRSMPTDIWPPRPVPAD